MAETRRPIREAVPAPGRVAVGQHAGTVFSALVFHVLEHFRLLVAGLAASGAGGTLFGADFHYFP